MSRRDPAIAERRARIREARARLAILRGQLREAIGAKRARMRELARIIRAERLALRERLRAHRKQTLEELRARAQAEHAAAREQWARRRAEAMAEATSVVDRARVDVAAGRERMAADVAAARRLREEAAVHGRAQREQSDDTVRGLIPSELVPFFDRVKSKIRGDSSQSRAEALLFHAERHPEDVFKLVEPIGEARIHEVREAIADVSRAARGQGVANYAEKRAGRIDRMRGRAERLGTAARNAEARGRSISDNIPFGQPVLIGHHSQARHERDLERIRSSFTKSIVLAEEARVLERRADSAERGTAVSSDDPDAITKLREKLARLHASRERMRAANAAIRAGGDVVAALGTLGFREDQARTLLEKDFAGRIGFPDYALRNAGAEAARLERRIRQLEERAATPAPGDVVLGDARIHEEENRVQVIFPDIPPEETRRALKAAGFRWARSAGAWQRHASPGAWHAAREALATYVGRAARGSQAS
jgi:hypothetical protein